ncbi:MAG: exonuclease domain-containing protein [Alphaproteobacteria bacterium]|nr:exonuclease domain-containing protein [Alphaproteobacteria bacterium]
MRQRLRHAILLAFGASAALLAGLVLLGEFGDDTVSVPAALRNGWAIALLAIGVPVFIWTAIRIDRIFTAFNRLRGFIVMLQTDHVEELPTGLSATLPGEVQDIPDAIDALLTGRLARQNAPARQLETVIGAIPEAIIVINTAGQIGLVNAAAQDLLGVTALEAGTSVFDAITRPALDGALDAASRAGGSVDTTVAAVDGRELPVRLALIGSGQGAVLVFRAGLSTADRALQHDLSLLAEPPPPIAITPSTPLAELPIFVLDLETTGLNVARDAIVSVGGVRMAGGTIYPGRTIDHLVNPDRPIPPRSTAIHGITDEMVAAAPVFSQLWPELAVHLEANVLVGHNIGFDIAHLLRSTREAGIVWDPPPYLCTYRLAGALRPRVPSLELERLAAEFGVTARGRHTALGDSLVTADLFARLLPVLEDQGVRTFGDAMIFSRRRKDIVKLQRESGWWIARDD